MNVTDNEYSLTQDIFEVWHYTMSTETPEMHVLGWTFWTALCAVRDGAVEAKA